MDGDTHSFQTMSKDAEGLRRAMEATVSDANQLKRSLINWTAVATSAQTLGSAVNRPYGAFKGLSDVYAVQVEGESQSLLFTSKGLKATSKAQRFNSDEKNAHSRAYTSGRFCMYVLCRADAGRK